MLRTTGYAVNALIPSRALTNALPEAILAAHHADHRDRAYPRRRPAPRAGQRRARRYRDPAERARPLLRGFRISVMFGRKTYLTMAAELCRHTWGT